MYKIGIVGAGAMGDAHKKAIEKNEGVVMTAVCDLALERAEELVRGTDARAYSDYKDMCEKEKLDAVILNLPHFLHREVSIYFLEHKVAVLVEKPMAMTVSECDAMIATAKKNNTPLAVGHVQRYFECYRELRKIILSGRLGSFCHMTETRNIEYFSRRPKWFLDKKLAGGGIIMNYGAHTLDKLFYTLGAEAEEVYATGNNFLTDDSIEASAQMSLKLKGGTGAAFTYCGCNVPSHYETYFYFTNGAAKIVGGEVLYISEGGKPYEKVELDYENVFDRVMELQMAEFIKLLNGEETEVVAPEYGRRIIAVLEKAVNQF